MNKIQRILLSQLRQGNPKLRKLFEAYVQNMGHDEKEAKTIVERVLQEDRSILQEDSLAAISKFNKESV